MAVANDVTKRTGGVVVVLLSLNANRFWFGPSSGKPKIIDNATKAVWRRQFTPLLLPHLPVLATLMETAEKLNAAKGFIEPLSHQITPSNLKTLPQRWEQ